MKQSHFLPVVAVAGLVAISLSTRAEDPLPPKPPGATNPPAAPAPPATTPNSPSSTEPGPSAGGKSRAAEFFQMLKKVGLTDEQLEKIKPVFAQQMEKLKGLRDDTSMTTDQKREKGREIFMGAVEQLKPILTPEQLTKLKDEMEKRRAARQQKQQ